MKDSRRSYPAQTGTYAVKVKNGAGWRAYDTARMQISVGQEYHDGEKFEATVEWLGHRFDKVIICVNDTLQMYNDLYKTNLSPEQAFQKAQKEGDEWLARNADRLKTLPNCEIYRWEDWKTHTDYKKEKDYVSFLYQKDNYFKDMVDQNVLIFWKRRENENYHFARFKEASIQYLLEEIAVFFLMFRMHKAVDIYPGSILLPCVLANKYCPEVKNVGLGDRAFTRIDFSRNHDLAELIAANDKPIGGIQA